MWIIIGVLVVAAAGGVLYWGRDQRSQEQQDMDNNRYPDEPNDSGG